MLQGIRAFVFDFDGTLAIPNIDFALMRQRVNAIAARYGFDPDQFNHLYILEMINMIAAQLEEPRPGNGEGFYRDAHDSILALEAECARTGGMLPGAVEVLRVLRQQGFKVGVVTRNSEFAVRTICATIDALCDVFLPREAV
ncbi:MAG: haloacid dehalogenase-like hydrolase, partial [Candidatus Tectomicrobia bacterium]|nr:haloacid dehalogenase-like hydrolase [Candidatus Tectomicrobia bacterium]